MNIFQELYDSEINFQVSCLWDGGFDVAIGDCINGFQEECTVDTWREVAPLLQELALTHYPDSKFTRDILNHKRALYPQRPQCPPWLRGFTLRALRVLRGKRGVSHGYK